MERDEALIEAVREYPCLYNSRSPDFKVQLKKENAWTAVADLLKRSGKQCDIQCAIYTLLKFVCMV